MIILPEERMCHGLRSAQRVAVSILNSFIVQLCNLLVLELSGNSLVRLRKD